MLRLGARAVGEADDRERGHPALEVRLHLEPGSCIVSGRRGPYSLYDYALATYDAADQFRHADSAGGAR